MNAVANVTPVNQETGEQNKEAIPVAIETIPGKVVSVELNIMPNQDLKGKPSVPTSADKEIDSNWWPSFIDYQTVYMGLVCILVASMVVLGILIALSMYYRVYLSRHRTPLFDAPSFLKMFFPKPLNYEHEITVLCSKYLDN